MKLIDYSYDDQDYFTETFLNRCKKLNQRVESDAASDKPNVDAFLLSQMQINH
ncbi:MAG: hypothetical protein ACON35_06450 [Candidatus Marinamargulisbacteria bacterium]